MHDQYDSILAGLLSRSKIVKSMLRFNFLCRTLAADPMIDLQIGRLADDGISVGGSQDYSKQKLTIPHSAKDSTRPSDSYNSFRSKESGTEEGSTVSLHSRGDDTIPITRTLDNVRDEQQTRCHRGFSRVSGSIHRGKDYRSPIAVTPANVEGANMKARCHRGFG